MVPLVFLCNPLNPIKNEFGIPTAMSSVIVQNLELAGHNSSDTSLLDQGLANVFWKGPDSTYFRLGRPHSLYYNH